MPYSLNLISYFPLLVNTYNLIFFIIAQIHYVFNTLSHHITKMLFFQYFFIKSRCNGERRVFLKHENPLKFKDFKILVRFWLRQSDVMLHIVMLLTLFAVMFAHFAAMRGILYFILSYQSLFGACPQRWHPLPVQ